MGSRWRSDGRCAVINFVTEKLIVAFRPLAVLGMKADNIVRLGRV
jgi:hypothetical protein